MTTTVIVSDVHARHAKLRALLQRIGVLGTDGCRQPGFRVVQIGDLVNLGYHVPERDFLEQAWPWFDVHLVGNHELPALQRIGAQRTFWGWNDRDHDATAFVADRAADYRAATSVGPWLVTHAGVTSHHLAAVTGAAEDDLADPEVVAQLAHELHARFRSAVDAGASIELVDGVGAARGGPDAHPGIFWTDLAELEADYAATPALALQQIVGHTPGAPPHLLANGRLWCIDTPGVEPRTIGGVSALVTTDDGASFTLDWQR